jgi:uncharacterized protein (TIGR03067 family)
MSKHPLFALVLIVLVGAGSRARSADREKDQAVKQFKESLQREWQMTSRIQPSEAKLIKNRTVIFVGDEYTVRDGEKTISALSYKIDPTTKPAWLDVIPKDANHGNARIIKREGDQLRKKAITRRDLARSAFDGYLPLFQFNKVSEQTVNLWSRRLLHAQLDLSDKKADRDAALRAHQDRLKKVDEIARARLDLGGSPQNVRSTEEEMKNHETVLQDFMNSKATPEQVCHASARLLMAQQVYRKQVIKTIDIKHPNAKPVIDKIEKDSGIDLRVENSEFLAHLDRVKKVEAITRARENAGMYPHMESETAAFYRLQAEEWLEQKKMFSDAILNPGADQLIEEKKK